MPGALTAGTLTDASALPFLTDTAPGWEETGSGRLTRARVSGLTQALAGADIEAAPYPEMWTVMRSVELAARRENRDDLMEMPCGQGAPLVREGSAADVVARLVKECADAGVAL